MLQSIIVTPKAFPGLHVLFLLIGPSLRSLEIFSCSKISDYADIPPDWEAYAGESKEAFREEVQENLIAVLPKVSVSSLQLQSFTYRGPFSNDLFHHISQLKGLVSMQLTMANLHNGLLAPLGCFSKLASLRHLVLEAPLLQAETSLPHPLVVALDTLKITTNPGQHSCLRDSIHFSNLRKLALEFTCETSALSLHLTIKSYLKRSRQLESFSVIFLPGRPLVEDEPIESEPARRQRRKEEKKARTFSTHAMQHATDLKQIHMMNVPPSLMKSTASVLRSAMPSWPHLTILVFCVQEQPPSPNSNLTTEKVSSGLPGVYFLGNTVWQSCPQLRELEFHFDEDIIEQEKLGVSIAFRTSSSRDNDHPLQILRINTTSSTLDLSLGKKIEIATFLDRLFPRLDILKGSALGVWEEVEMLVKSYQAVKEHVYARIEAL
jgi:hypothetical protein